MESRVFHTWAVEASAPADVIFSTSTGGTNKTNSMAMVNAILPGRDAELIAVLEDVPKPRLRLRMWVRGPRLRLGLRLRVVVERKD